MLKNSFSDEDHTLILKALADETRLRLIRILQKEELNVQEICEITTLPQPKISRHLAVLKNSNLLNDRRDGTRIFYTTVNLEKNCPSLSEYINTLVGSDHPDLSRLEKVILKRAKESRDVMHDLADQWDEVISSLHHPGAAVFALPGFAPKGMKIADLGCGTGLLLPLLDRFDGEIYAVDQSDVMLAKAQKRAEENKLNKINFVQSDLTSGELNIPKCDALLLHFVMHQIPSPQSLLKSIARCCEKNGRIIIVDMNHHEDESTRERFGSVWLGFDQAQLEEWLQEAGFSQINFSSLQENSKAGQNPFVCIAVKAD
ncbi:regulatory protein, ArsR [Lentisphaera araneosa HTCC2155]|uniref:Regulatory protein, ArsR n=1 Tax=Lentisphaera araneosa HTCC2155 TaxID=313628 RepID=A6DHD7_9BACT|nr:metalloregulator ArsR/SmtB family transcription factor [Lentisphaera araneosa]EDM29020.1 regulatory protein, ArsR [Lentisphaera araneosa HTCC2155]